MFQNCSNIAVCSNYNNFFNFLIIPSLLDDCTYRPHYTNKKKKKPGDTISYCPISFLISLSKLTEIFIAGLLNDHITNNITSLNRFGLRKGLSTPHQVYKLVEHITTAKAHKIFIAAVFLNFEKAHYKVYIYSLNFKLVNHISPLPQLKLIYHYFLDRNFHV